MLIFELTFAQKGFILNLDFKLMVKILKTLPPPESLTVKTGS